MEHEGGGGGGGRGVKGAKLDVQGIVKRGGRAFPPEKDTKKGAVGEEKGKKNPGK